nr:expressed protein [Hymenolepis microstoma]
MYGVECDKGPYTSPLFVPLKRATSANQEEKKTPERPKTPVDPEARIKFPHAIVIANFYPKHEYELGAKKGSVIGLLERHDDHWYYACTFDMTKAGYIPSDFLRVIIELPPSTQKVAKRPCPPKLRFEDCRHFGTQTESVPESTPESPATVESKKLREDADLFLLVTNTFRPQSDVDIGAKAGDIMLCLDRNVKFGKPVPCEWVYCMNLGGRAGVFPGNWLQILDSPSEIDELLQKAPHAIATTSICHPPDGYVQISLGEAFYIEKLVDDSVFGRTASGQVGKLALDDCDVIVPP